MNAGVVIIKDVGKNEKSSINIHYYSFFVETFSGCTKRQAAQFVNQFSNNLQNFVNSANLPDDKFNLKGRWFFSLSGIKERLECTIGANGKSFTGDRSPQGSRQIVAYLALFHEESSVTFNFVDTKANKIVGGGDLYPNGNSFSGTGIFSGSSTIKECHVTRY